MSGLARSYEKAISKEIGAHAAWFPVTNTLKVGDFGYFEGGVFRALGNLKDRYPDIVLKTALGPGSKLNFTSEGTKVSRIGAGGTTTDTFATLGNVQAALTYKFGKENSLVLKAEKIIVEQLQNIDDVGMALASKSNWRKKYKVVSAAYTGENCLIICAREAGSEFTIKASANILSQIEGGKAEGGFETSSSNDSTYESIGESGVLAIRMFKLNIFKKTQLVRGEQPSATDLKIEDILDLDIQDDF